MNGNGKSQNSKNDGNRKELKDLFRQCGIQLKGNIGKGQYAKRCFMRKRAGLHLVLSGSKGPVTVLFLFGDFVKCRVSSSGAGMDGMIIPCALGSLAIIGSKNEPLDKIEHAISENVRWSYCQ